MPVSMTAASLEKKDSSQAALIEAVKADLEGKA